MTHVRAARDLDAGDVGLILSSFIDETPWMPRLYTRAEDVAHAGRLISKGWVSVVEREGRVVGFGARDGEEVEALYISPDARRMGVGSLLVSHFKSEIDRLCLWTFQANCAAQAFYIRHGFSEVRRTDGARNEERLPDIQFEWHREAG